jgi:hypothetical protein
MTTTCKPLPCPRGFDPWRMWRPDHIPECCEEVATSFLFGLPEGVIVYNILPRLNGGRETTWAELFRTAARLRGVCRAWKQWIDHSRVWHAFMDHLTGAMQAGVDVTIEWVDELAMMIGQWRNRLESVTI